MRLDGKRTRGLLTAAVVVVAVVAVVLAIVLIPKAMDSGRGEGSLKSTRGSTTSTFAQTMPSDAAGEAADWFIGKTKLLDGKFDADFFTDSSKGTKTLDAMADGDFSAIPRDLQNAVTWTRDAQAEDQTVSYVNKRASAYTALIAAWQLRASGLKKNARLAVDEKSITVDRDHGLVYIPVEAICGYPAALTFVMKWTGNDWKIDGDMIGNQMAAAVRSAQFVYEANNSNGASASGAHEDDGK